MSFSTPWLVFAMILAAMALAMMFVPRLPACITAYMAMWAGRFSGYAPLSDTTLIFWGIAVAIVIVNRFLLPPFIRNSSRGLGYIATGAIVGMALGLTLYTAASVIGFTILGALVAAIAYAKTAQGASLEFPTVKFFNYLGAKGIPAVMAASMVGLVLASLIVTRS